MSLFLFAFVFTAKAQTVTLAVSQDYSLPETPSVTQDADTLHSSVISGNQWYKNGGLIAGATAQTYVVTSSGDYRVTVTDPVTGCSAASGTLAVVKTAIAIIETTGFTYGIFPNPNNGSFTVEIAAEQAVPVVLELFSVDGKVVARQQFKSVSGKNSFLFGKENLVKGIYSLQIRCGNKTINRKLIVD